MTFPKAPPRRKPLSAASTLAHTHTHTHWTAGKSSLTMNEQKGSSRGVLRESFNVSALMQGSREVGAEQWGVQGKGTSRETLRAYKVTRVVAANRANQGSRTGVH